MMAEYIDKAKLLESFSETKENALRWEEESPELHERIDGVLTMLMECKLRIKAFPAADVQEVKHGKWNRQLLLLADGKMPWGCKCSVCGKWIQHDYEVVERQYKYCPYCGADMRGE